MAWPGFASDTPVIGDDCNDHNIRNHINDSLIQFMYFSIFEYDHAKFYVISCVCLIMIYIF
jgi:hypothetical protein